MLNECHSDYIKEIQNLGLPDYVEEFFDSGKLSRRIKAECIPDTLVNVLKALSPIADDPENPINWFFQPISNRNDSSSFLRYKKQILVLEREVADVEALLRDKEELLQKIQPYADIGKKYKTDRKKGYNKAEFSNRVHFDEDKKKWVAEAQRIQLNNSAIRSSSALAHLVIKNLGLPSKHHEAIRKELQRCGFKAYKKNKTRINQ